MYLVINKWVIAVKVSNSYGQYLRNRWTFDIGVLGYIGIVWPKKHSPEVWSVPPVTPCMCLGLQCFFCNKIYSKCSAASPGGTQLGYIQFDIGRVKRQVNFFGIFLLVGNSRTYHTNCIVVKERSAWAQHLVFILFL